MFREFVNACWFALKWGLLAALVASVGLGFYFYTQLNDRIRQRVEAKFAAHYPHLKISVRGAHLIDGEGIEVRGLLISDPRQSGPQAELAYFDEILLCCQTNLQELLQGTPDISQIIVRRPRLHATRTAEGGWSFQQLLPLPKFGDRPLNLTVENGQAIVFDMQRDAPTTFTLRDIKLELKPPADDAASGRADGPSKLSDIRGSLAADRVGRVDFAGRLDRDSGWFDVSGTVAGIDVSPELMAALPAAWTERLAPLAPLRGQAGFDFHVWRDEAQVQPVRFSLHGSLDAGRFEDTRLPQALANLTATFRADNDGFILDRLSAANGPSTLELSGRIDGYQAGAPIVAAVKAQHLLIGPQWEALLPPKMLKQWRKFLPAGEIHLREARLVYDGTKWRTQAIIDCLNVSFSYYRFPYRLLRGSGTVTLTADNRLVLDLTAYAASRPVKISGEIDNPGPGFTGSVTLSGQQLPFDADLYEALEKAQPKSCQVVQSLDPKGTFNFWVQTWRDDPAQAKMNQRAIIGLNRCSISYEKFPYGVHNVTGQLEMLNGQWAFRDLRGANHGGQISGEGHLKQIDGGSHLWLRLVGSEMMLEDELRNALPTRMKRLWDDLDPQGSVHIETDLNYTTLDRQLKLRTTIEPVADADAPLAALSAEPQTHRRSSSIRTVSIHPVFFPYRLEKVQGKVVYQDGHVELNGMRAVHDATPVTAQGWADCDADGGWHVHFDKLTIDGVRPDRDRQLVAALPPALRRAVVELNPTGLVSMRGQLDLWGRPHPAQGASSDDRFAAGSVRSAWNATVDMQQGSLQAGVDLKNIHGQVRLAGEFDPAGEPGGRLRSRGELDVDSISWNGFQFTNVRGPMWLDDRQVIFGSAAATAPAGSSPRRVVAKVYGGVLHADAWIGLEQTPQFSVQAVLADGDLNRLCTEAIAGRQQLRGKVLASIGLQGTAAGLHTLSGEGQVRLEQADIYELPVMVALLKILNFRRPDTNAFSTSDIKFRVHGEHITLDNIEFSGDAVSLRGTGEMKLNTEVNLTLHSLVGRSDLQLPAWKTLVGGASEQIMQIHVTGTLANPQTSREAFPTISQALQSLQTGMQTRQRPVIPQSMRPFERREQPQWR